LQKEIRLKLRRDFKKVYTYGSSVANRELVIYLKDNPKIETFRFGISVSKKIGNAVVRNRVKRLLKEVLRSLIEEIDLKKHKDIVIIARKPTANMSYFQFDKSVRDLFRKSKLIEKKK